MSRRARYRPGGAASQPLARASRVVKSTSNPYSSPTPGCGLREPRFHVVALARMFHQQSAAARDRAASTALRSVAVLDVPPSTPAGSDGRAPCICSPLIAPRCDRGETSGLGPEGAPCSTYCSNAPPRGSHGAPRWLRLMPLGPRAAPRCGRDEKCGFSSGLQPALQHAVLFSGGENRGFARSCSQIHDTAGVKRIQGQG